MSALLIIGAGGHGQVIADVASALGEWSSISFLDDRPEPLPADLDWRVSGTLDSMEEVVKDFDAVFVGLGDNRLRLEWIERIERIGVEVPTIVSPMASVSLRSEIGPGTVVMPGGVVNIGAVVGKGGLINTGASVDHHCVLGDAVHIAPGANLGGGVRVGDRSLVGIGASVRPEVVIGSDVTVGVGAAVDRDLADGCTVVGVPARPRP